MATSKTGWEHFLLMHLLLGRDKQALQDPQVATRQPSHVLQGTLAAGPLLSFIEPWESLLNCFGFDHFLSFFKEQKSISFQNWKFFNEFEVYCLLKI